MANYEQKPNTGVLFKNEKKTATNHPDYTGKMVDANGKEYRIGAWIKEGKKGKFFSLSFSEPNESKPAQGTDDLPF